MVYLDANASEPLRPAARKAVLAALEVVGNPASVHTAGRAARRLLEDARERIAAHFGAAPAGVVFTSGGTESATLALRGLGEGRRVVIGATEHDCIRSAAPEAMILAVDEMGRADLARLEAILADGPPALVCLMLANNETGVIHPIEAAVEICRRHGALLVADAAQAAGRIAVNLTALGTDAIILSGHKLGGPAGAGALLLREDLDLKPLIPGGGQEMRRRGGTPDLPAIVGMAAALGPVADLSALRNAAERHAIAHGAVVCGAGVPRLSNTTCLALPGVRADTQVIALDLAGIQVSAGAACSSGKVAESHVLAAMGLGPLAGQAIRVSFPWNASEADLHAFAGAYASMADRLARRAA